VRQIRNLDRRGALAVCTGRGSSILHSLLSRADDAAGVTTNHFNALPATAIVFVMIFASWGVVGDLRRVNRHGVWTFGEVCWATCPRDCALREGWIAAGPDSKTETHGCLRESGAALCIVVVECSYGDAVDHPGDCCGSPVHGICVPLVLRVCDGNLNHPRIIGLVGFAKVV
jgi:hypothetical protein